MRGIGSPPSRGRGGLSWNKRSRKRESGVRQNIRRLTRLTQGHSKKLGNHIHAMALWFLNYNFARKHHTLTQRANGVHTSPAMAAGLTDHVWSLDEVLALLDQPRIEAPAPVVQEATEPPKPYRRRVRH